nr:leucine-rich repeat extensin-like protein 5 [Aegilops tauschii subsp. strangulata]
MSLSRPSSSPDPLWIGAANPAAAPTLADDRRPPDTEPAPRHLDVVILGLGAPSVPRAAASNGLVLATASPPTAPSPPGTPPRRSSSPTLPSSPTSVKPSAPTPAPHGEATASLSSSPPARAHGRGLLPARPRSAAPAVAPRPP